jgi:hypothetical protein
MDTKALIEARKKAEAAVADMPEGELRVEAFKMILNRLLVGDEAADTARKNRRKRRSATELHGSGPDAEPQRGDAMPRSAPERILSLKGEGFFSEPRGIGEIREELQTHAWRYDVTALSGSLMTLVQRKHLRRSKVTDGKKTIYKYFNP